MLNSFLAALQFLTVFPLQRQFDAQTMARSQLAFPVVGLAIGAVLCTLAWWLPDSPQAVAVLLLIVWVIATGGLHLDGLADSADAWAAGRGDAQRALAVMKDPRCGPIAVVAVALVLIAKFAAISALLSAGDWAVLLAAPMLGRCAALLLLQTTDYVREQGLGQVYRQPIDTLRLWRILALFIALGFLLAGFWAVLCAALLLLVLRWLMQRQIGGSTGDTIGASIEIIETCTLLVAAMLML